MPPNCGAHGGALQAPPGLTRQQQGHGRQTHGSPPHPPRHRRSTAGVHAVVCQGPGQGRPCCSLPGARLFFSRGTPLQLLASPVSFAFMPNFKPWPRKVANSITCPSLIVSNFSNRQALQIIPVLQMMVVGLPGAQSVQRSSCFHSCSFWPAKCRQLAILQHSQFFPAIYLIVPKAEMHG